MRIWEKGGGRVNRVLVSAALLLVLLTAFSDSGTRRLYLPLFDYAAQGGKEQAFVQDTLLYMLPVCVYGMGYTSIRRQDDKIRQDEEKKTEILLSVSEEWEEGSSRETAQDSGDAAGTPGEVQAEETPDIQELLEQENTAYRFTQPTRQAAFNWDALGEYETLMAAFYTVDSTALAGSDLFNLESLCGMDLSLKEEGDGPQILIYHTHSREAFADSEPGDPSQTVVGVGELLADILTSRYGYRVMHDTTQYDTLRDEAYARSLPALERILEENPSIQVVIDLHRDSAGAERDMVVELDGKRTARFMFFNGISRSRTAGDIEYLSNPNLAANLAFSFQMQALAGEYYPGVTRKIYIKQYRYNMHLCPRTLLIELGDETNTLEEAKNACYPIAFLLNEILSGEASFSSSSMR